MKTQLFLMSRDFLRAMETDAVKETYNDMVELGIARAPYSDFTIQVPMGPVINTSDKGSLDQQAEQGDKKAQRLQNAPLRVVYKNQYEKGQGEYTVLVSDKGHKNWKPINDFVYEKLYLFPPKTVKEHQDQMSYMASVLRSILIVALATKGHRRETVHNRLARLGIGKQDYEYVTTISIGHAIDDPNIPHTTTGMTKRPHLRRGHVRDQRYGPGLQFVKKVWIEPCFVNGYTPDTNDQRLYYNVKGAQQ